MWTDECPKLSIDGGAARTSSANRKPRNNLDRGEHDRSKPEKTSMHVLNDTPFHDLSCDVLRSQAMSEEKGVVLYVSRRRAHDRRQQVAR